MPGEVVDNEMNAMFRRLVERRGKAVTWVLCGEEGSALHQVHYAQFPAPCDKAIVTELREAGFRVRLFGTCDVFLWDVTPP